jgi:hypothetical protein
MLVLIAAATMMGLSAQDTVVVQADNPRLWGDSLHLVEEVRIGVDDGGRFSLGRVQGMAVTVDGVMWVADQVSSSIHRFTEDGRYLGSIGGNGYEQGEFQRLDALHRMSDGRVIAWDPAQTRVTLFSIDGVVSRVINLPRLPVTSGNGSNTRETFRSGSHGRFFLLGPMPTADERSRYMYWLGFDSTGVLQDTSPLPAPNADDPEGGVTRYGFGAMRPFSAATRWALNPDGNLVTGRNSSYTLDVPQREGGVVRITREWSPVPVPPVERAAREALVGYYDRRFNLRRRIEVPARKPAYWAFWVDQEERIWVARHTEAVRIPETPEERAERQKSGNPPSEWWESLQLDVIGPTGQFLGAVALPDHQTKLWVARGRRIWVVEPDSTGADQVVRYRVEQAGPPAS